MCFTLKPLQTVTDISVQFPSVQSVFNSFSVQCIKNYQIISQVG